MSDSTELTTAEVAAMIAEVPHWHHVLRFPQGVTTPGAYDPALLMNRLDLPKDLSGQRVLDVGTRDGYFAFACEARGAEVVAIDNCPPSQTGFEVARRIFGSRVEYELFNVYDLSPERFGSFDIVLFLGVLYHLRHPLLALDRLRSVCRGTLYLESFVCDDGILVGFEEARRLADVAPALSRVPIAQFLPQGRFHPDWTNKWVPNIECLRALLEDSLFAPRDVLSWGSRALVRADVVENHHGRWRLEQDAGTSG